MSMPRKMRCRVNAITDHGERVYTVELAPENPAPAFSPGQFLHLTVDAYDPSSFWPESRVFSIASSPRDRSRLRICYSVKGRYTTRMEQALRVGGEVWIKLPYGNFVIDSAADAVLVAGGTGISAYTAFVEALDPQSAQRVKLVYGARAPSLFLFKDMILAQLAKVPRFEVVFFTETADATFAREMTALPRPAVCLNGRISLDSLWSQLDEPLRKTYYLSGPPVMLKTLGADLKARGLEPDRIRTDAWE